MKSIFDIKTESELTAALANYCDKHELPNVCANELLADCHGHVAWLTEFIRQWEKVQGANDSLVQTLLEQGFELEQGGGGCTVLSIDMENGAFVWITCLDGGGLPEAGNWMICAYGEDIGDIIFELRSDQNDDDLSLSQAVAIAIDVANDFEPKPCTNWHRHRDSGRGVCIDCGAFL
jgi:hypothetical protein